MNTKQQKQVKLAHSWSEERTERAAQEKHKKKIVNLIYYVQDSFRSAIPSFHSRTTTLELRSFMRPASGMSVMYSPSSSTQESGLASVRASSQRERKAEDRQEIDKKLLEVGIEP